MIPLQEAVQKYIEEVEKELEKFECNLDFRIRQLPTEKPVTFFQKLSMEVAEDYLTKAMADYMYWIELLDALKGVDRLEKAYKLGKKNELFRVPLEIQWGKEKK